MPRRKQRLRSRMRLKIGQPPCERRPIASDSRIIAELSLRLALPIAYRSGRNVYHRHGYSLLMGSEAQRLDISDRALPMSTTRRRNGVRWLVEGNREMFQTRTLSRLSRTSASPARPSSRRGKFAMRKSRAWHGECVGAERGGQSERASEGTCANDREAPRGRRQNARRKSRGTNRRRHSDAARRFDLARGFRSIGSCAGSANQTSPLALTY